MAPEFQEEVNCEITNSKILPFLFVGVTALKKPSGLRWTAWAARSKDWHKNSLMKGRAMKSMVRFMVTTVAIVMLGSMAAFASNVHLVGGLTVTDNGTSAKVCGKLAGLGNQDITINLVGSVTVESTCVNPAGHIAPGHADQVVTGTIHISRTEIKNGSVSFCVQTADPVCRTAKACGCPNNNWTATILNVDFHLLNLTVEQGGKVVLQQGVL